MSGSMFILKKLWITNILLSYLLINEWFVLTKKNIKNIYLKNDDESPFFTEKNNEQKSISVLKNLCAPIYLLLT